MNDWKYFKNEKMKNWKIALREILKNEKLKKWKNEKMNDWKSFKNEKMKKWKIPLKGINKNEKLKNWKNEKMKNGTGLSWKHSFGSQNRSKIDPEPVQNRFSSDSKRDVETKSLWKPILD